MKSFYFSAKKFLDLQKSWSKYLRNKDKGCVYYCVGGPGREAGLRCCTVMAACRVPCTTWFNLKLPPNFRYLTALLSGSQQTRWHVTQCCCSICDSGAAVLLSWRKAVSSLTWMCATGTGVVALCWFMAGTSCHTDVAAKDQVITNATGNKKSIPFTS